MADKWTPWKSRLTKAQKKGPFAVLDEWTAFELYCQKNGWPDWWFDFQIAAGDANNEIRICQDVWAV